MKGIISPIGDDIPSIMIIVMALTLFFSGIVFTLDIYNEKVENINYLTGAIDIARVIVSYGAVNSLAGISLKAEYIANSYGLTYDVFFRDKASDCYPEPVSECRCKDKESYMFDFAVASNRELRILGLKICKAA